MKFTLWTIFVLFTALLSCNNVQSDQNKMIMTDEIFKKNVIIILSSELDMKSNIINVQDYIVNGKSFIPVFTSMDKFNESTKGAVKNTKIEINGMFFLSLLKGNEELHVNPSLEDELIINSAELIKRHDTRIKEVLLEMQKLKEEKQ